MRRCDRCQHYFGYPPGDQPDRISFSGGQVRGGGECRRNPPVVCGDSQPIGSFPIVFNDYWCGHFESNPPHTPTSQPKPVTNINTTPITTASN